MPLDKSPGVRAIGICEVLHRIIGKAITIVAKPDVLKATGYNQLCAGKEVAVHAISDLYEHEESNGFIHIDGGNAFNAINRSVNLHNIKIICPKSQSMSPIAT